MMPPWSSVHRIPPQFILIESLKLHTKVDLHASPRDEMMVMLQQWICSRVRKYKYPTIHNWRSSAGPLIVVYKGARACSNESELKV